MQLPKISTLIRRHKAARDTATVGATTPFAQLEKFSNLSATARYRHIQSVHENCDLRNPDILAGALMTEAEREECKHFPPEGLARMRAGPYYYYLTARTKFYDQLVLDAVASGMRRILIVGAGFDTRLYRFGGHLAAFDVEVAECDQADAVEMKKSHAKDLPYARRVGYFGADLNQRASLDKLLGWLGNSGGRKTLVLAEGVSPYIETSAFESALGAAIPLLEPGSWFAYDFKRRGVADQFGAGSDVLKPFRLPLDAEVVHEFHKKLGCATVSLTSADALMKAHVPSWNPGISLPYDEDAIVKTTR